MYHLSRTHPEAGGHIMRTFLVTATVAASLVGSALPSTAAVLSYTDTSLNGTSWGTQSTESRDFTSRTLSVTSGDPLQFQGRYDFTLLTEASFQEFTAAFSGGVNVAW